MLSSMTRSPYQLGSGKACIRAKRALLSFSLHHRQHRTVSFIAVCVVLLSWWRVAPTFLSPPPGAKTQLPQKVGRGRQVVMPSQSLDRELPQFDALVLERTSVFDSKFQAKAMGAFHLTKGIVGTSWLSLPAGVAAIAGSVEDELVLPFVAFLLLAITAISAYSYREVARCAAETKSNSFAEAFERSGAGSASFAAMVTSLNCLGGCVSCAMILGDTGMGLLHSGGFEVASGLETPVRFAAIALISAALLRPACAKLDLRAMEWSSVAGVVATALTAMVMFTRLADGTYTEPFGEFAATASQAADRTSQSPMLGMAGTVMVFVSLLTNSFLAHQCAPQLRQSVDRSLSSQEETQATANFDSIILVGFLLSFALYATVTVCGFLTFGLHTSGNVLDNYAVHDPLAAFARLATTACLICSFPQMLLGLRDAIKDLLGLDSRDEGWLSPELLLSIVAVLAGCFTDLTAVMAVQGAVLGSLLVYTLPAMMVGSQEGYREGPRAHHALFSFGALVGTGGVATWFLQGSAAAGAPEYIYPPW